MKKQINIVKDGVVTHSNIVTSTEKDAWILATEAAFPEGYTVEEADVTAVIEKTLAVDNRSKIREKCLKVIDLVAVYNESATPETMATIFSSPAFVGITLALLTGAPNTAKAAIIANGAGLYSAEQVSEIVGQLDAIIASEGV